MFSRLFSKRAKVDAAPLLADLVGAARAPEPYRDLGVADTFEGRFEYLALVSTLVLERLAALEGPGDALAQELVDAIFTHLDDALRRAGISDISVGKRVKKLARSFYGRVNAYRDGLAEGEGALREALSRNLYAGALDAQAVPEGLLARIAAHRAALAQAPLPGLQAGKVLCSGASHVGG